MASCSLFGWDLLYKSVEDDIKNNQEVLLCLTHLVLVSEGFRCIGLGESKTLDGDEQKSESLPKNWNEHYSIRYVHQGKLYNLKATPLEDAMMINLIRVEERTVSFLQLNVRSVASRSGPLEEMIPNYANIVDQIKAQLIRKVIISNKTKESSVQTDTTQTGRIRDRQPDNDPLRVPPHPATYHPVLPDYGPAGYGRSDLDPLGGMGPLRLPGTGGGGGGMLFQPPGPSFGGGYGGGNIPGPGVGLPPGAVPPGARFDPFRPPDVDRFTPRRPNRPDNDEFPPPGYDDMFM